MINEIPILLLALLAGTILGAFFFGGLWWTVRKIGSTRYPALLFFSSVVLRTGLVIAVFFLVTGGQWQRLLACLAGFVVARFLMLRYLHPPTEQETTLNHIKP